jgi:hypothetical protein
MTFIKTCSCKSEAQDALHGKNKRAMNSCAKGVRCTVCGKESGRDGK